MFLQTLITQNTVLTLGFLICASSSYGESANNPYTPASFGEGRAEFIEKLRFPDYEDGRAVLVECGSMAHLTGEMLGTICYSNGDFAIENRMRKVIIRAAETARISPAIIDGEKASVWFNFSVIYEQNGSAKSIEILENDLYDIESLGPHYTGAQRSTRYELHCFNPLAQLPITVIAAISAQGEMSNLQISRTPVENPCIIKAEDLMGKSVFIPAFVDGKPVPSTYNEVFHHYRYSPLH